MQTEQKNTKKIWISVIVLVVVVAALFGVYQITKGKTVKGERSPSISYTRTEAQILLR